MGGGTHVKVLIHLAHHMSSACLMGVVLTLSQPTSMGDCSLFSSTCTLSYLLIA